MSTLLLQSCSASKQEVDEKVEAIDLYTGYFYRIIKKARRAAELRPDIDIMILSAKHGLLQPDERIRPYDERMDADRARELNEQTVSALRSRLGAETYDRVVVNMGKPYRKAIDGLDTRTDVPIRTITGSGIGQKGHVLHQFIRGDDAIVERDE